MLAFMEQWKTVAGWQGFYEVSSLGRVRSVDRRHPVINRFGNVENRLHRGKLLKPGRTKNGYLVVGLTRPGGVRETPYVHSLVADAFLGPKPPLLEVCHGVAGKEVNADYNLRYDTRSSNALDRHRDGTMNQARGEDHCCAKLTETDVQWIRSNSTLNAREMGEALGVHQSTVTHAAKGVTWKHVNPSYNASK